MYPDAEDQAERCSDVGVVGPLVGIIGSMQAMEAIKILTVTGNSLDGRLLVFDARTMHWRDIKIKKDLQCSVCSQ